MNMKFPKTLMTATSAAVLLALAGCDRSEEVGVTERATGEVAVRTEPVVPAPTVTPAAPAASETPPAVVGEARQESSQAAAEVSREASQAANTAERGAEQAGSEIAQGAREAGQAIREGASELGQEARQAAGAAGSAVMGAAGEAREATAQAGDTVDDAQITAKVNTALAGEQSLSATSIDVDTSDGVVTLKGTAPSQDAVQKAAELAREVEGVKSVQNKLEVQQADAGAAAGAATMGAAAGGTSQPAEPSQQAPTASAADGSTQDPARTEGQAQAASGERPVYMLLPADGAAAQADSGADATASMGAGAAGGASAEMGAAKASSAEASPMADVAIAAKVNTGLSVDKDLSATKIEVESKNGVVTLTGTAPSEEAKQRAAEIARNVDDVKEVKNELKVGGKAS